jgi:hypothetical protein
VTPNVEEHHPLCYTNTKCLQIEDEQPCGQSCSETPTSYVQIGKGSQFSSEPIYSSPKRNKPSFTDFDMTKKFQKQHSCESCNCRFEAEKELPMPTCCQADAQDKIYTNYDASMWKNLSSEDTTDKQQQQSFSSTYLHFEDDSGCCSHCVQPSYSRTRLSGRRRAGHEQTRNENIGLRCGHSESAMCRETPCVERVYKNIPAINSEFVS